MIDLKTGQKVIYFRRNGGTWCSRSAKKLLAEVVRVTKKRVSILLPDGTIKSVCPDNVEAIKEGTRNNA